MVLSICERSEPLWVYRGQNTDYTYKGAAPFTLEGGIVDELPFQVSFRQIIFFGILEL